MRIGPGNGSFEVVESEAVQQLIASEIERDPRIAELWEGLKWLISKSGHLIGAEIRFQGKNHRIYKTASTESGLPSIGIVYLHDVNQFVIKAASVVW